MESDATRLSSESEVRPAPLLTELLDLIAREVARQLRAKDAEADQGMQGGPQ